MDKGECDVQWENGGEPSEIVEGGCWGGERWRGVDERETGNDKEKRLDERGSAYQIGRGELREDG